MQICLFNIYAPNCYREKELCWNSLKDILLQDKNKSIIVGGNLNLVKNVEEKFGGSFHADPSQDSLESIIENHNLLDIPPNNEKYTWNKKGWAKETLKKG